MSQARKPVMYVNNAEFLDAFKKYIAEREQCKIDGKEAPRIPEEIGSAFIQIATRLSTRHNFNGYTYREEMVSDGIVNAVEAVNSFDPEKSANPFGYFTQVIFWAFLRRIEKEKKERKTRDDMMFSEEFESFVQAEGGEFNLSKDELYVFYNE